MLNSARPPDCAHVHIGMASFVSRQDALRLRQSFHARLQHNSSRLPCKGHGPPAAIAVAQELRMPFITFFPLDTHLVLASKGRGIPPMASMLGYGCSMMLSIGE